jgi:hypothetical protein
MTVSAIDRVFELAKSGQFRSVSEILRRVPAADRATVETQLAEPGARRELILVCSAAWLAVGSNDQAASWTSMGSK